MSQVTITTEQVHELIEQLAAMTAAASITPGIVANIFEKMRNLNDQEKVKLVAFSEAFIAELDERYSDIKREYTASEDKEIRIETDNGVLLCKVDPTGADFKFLRKNGKNVATEDQIPSVPTLDTIIGDNPSNSHTPSSKAVKEYVEAHSDDYPIDKESTQSEDEEQVWGNNAETQEYVKIGPYGMKSKAYLDMQGNSIIEGEIGDTPSTAHAPSVKAVKDYVGEHGTGDLPIEKTAISSPEEHVVIRNSADTEDVFKVTDEGLRVKSIKDLQGNPIGGINVSVQTISGKNYLVFG